MANTAALKYGISLGLGESDLDADKNDEVQDERHLVEAAAAGDHEKVLELLNSEVNVDAEEYNKLLFYASKNYVTPLQIAAANGHERCVQILIDRGADVNAKDRFDVTALHMAAEKGHYLCVKALLDGGADCCVPTKFSKTGCYTAVPHLGGTTPLHLAAANNHVKCVKELIQYGADYNAVDECGRTSLYIAAQAGFGNCVLAHLKNAVGRDILSLPSFETSDTPLHFAVTRGMVECVKELLYLGSDVNHINHLGCSPLHLALTPSNEKGFRNVDKLDILKLLVLTGYNTDINKPDAGGYTPLHYVCFNGYRNLWCRRPDMAKFLIAYGANVNIKNHQGNTLLEHELKSMDKNYDVLKYVVKSMLTLPRLKSLNVCARREPVSPPVEILPQQPFVQNFDRNLQMIENAILYRGLLPTPPLLQGQPQAPEMLQVQPGYPGAAQLFPAMAAADLNIPEFNAVFPGSLRRNYPPPPLRHRMMRYPRQPLLMHVYDALEGMIDERNMPENDNEAEDDARYDTAANFKKHVWYERLASNPRTLQHHCRYVIRSAMGPKRLKHIEKLPIPTALQSYLLLEFDE